MRKILFSLILLGLVGCAAPQQRVSPYLNGINVSHTDKWLRGQSPAGTVPSASSGTVPSEARIFKIVRFPGGLLADKYHWNSGIKTGAATADEMGTRDFAEFCEGIGAEKMITVNFKTGTPAEAANWVGFANGKAPEKIPAEWKKVPYAYNHKAPGGYFAYLREKFERREPYAVKFWEIGNEIDWWNRIDALSYAQETIKFARAMRQKDKSIQISACASITDDQWNKTLLKTAGRYIDFISIHIYGGPDRAYEDKNEEYKALFSKNRVVEERLIKIKQLLRKYAPHCKIAVTEANTSYNEFGLGKDELKKLKSALWIAGLRNTLLRQGVMAYCHWNLIDGGVYGVVNKDGTVTPAYEVLKLYAENTGSELGVMSYELGVKNNLDYVVTIDKENKRTYIMAVNVEPKAIEAEIKLRGQSPSGTVPSVTSVKVLKAADDLGLESQKVKIEEDECVVENGKIKYKFEPYSLTRIEIGC